jgi:signal transduction histidine kinase
MFAVPLVSLLALWIFAAATTVSNAVADHYYNSGVRIIDTGFASLTAALPAEQTQSYLWLASGRTASNASMLATRSAVTGAIPIARNAVAPVLGQFSAGTRADLNALLTDLARLASTRQAIDSGTISPLAAFQAYSAVIDAQWRFYFAAIKDNGAPLADDSIGATDASYAYQMGSREATLVGAALADRGQMSVAARQLFAATVANRRLLMSQALATLTPSLAAGYVSVTAAPPYQQLQAMEDQLSASADSSGPIPVDAAAWQSASDAYLAGMAKAEVQSGVLLSDRSASLSDRQLTEAILAAGLGLVAVVVSVFLLVWFGRKVTRDLTGLHGSVRGMAEERLPRVVERLRRGEDVDVLAESPPPAASTIREISQVAESFATVQAAAVEAAVDQARLRKGVNQVFLNISMRNQSLLHRQLGMLDSMERRATEPGELADLFRLDHLTTRMRRHAEGLIILSGSVPARGWRDPVPVVDVLRAAVAEVEDYVRVDVVSESRDLVAGGAVNDVIHLVAELVENATVFSPPNTRIEVRADRVGTGLVAEVEDRGLGLRAGERDEINRRLGSAPEFDPGRSDQLGLFVVGQLAARHNIRVSLRESVYGGTTAIVLLPFGVVVREEEAGRPDGAVVGPGVGGPALPLRGDGSASPANGSSHGSAAHGRSDEAAGAADVPSFGLTGRHRQAPLLPAAPDPAPRPVDAGAGAQAEEPAAQPSAGAVPIAPWEFEQPWPRSQPPEPAAPRPLAFRPAAARPEAPRDAQPTPPAQPAADAQPGTNDGERAAPASAASHLGMPIRVPQASLAPQLRSRREADPQTVPRDASEADGRTPEATRNMMALMQSGWQRGRADDLDDLQAPEDLGGGTDSEAE